MSSYTSISGALADGKVVINRTVENASVVLRTIFRQAQKRVCILTSNLDPAVFDREVGESAAGFLLENTNATLDVLIEHDIDLSRHEFFLQIAKCPSSALERVTVSKVRPEAQKAYTVNFVVADGQHFRFEGNRDSVEAVVQFSNPESGAALEAIFEQLKSVSDRMPLQRFISSSSGAPLSFG